MHDKLVTGHIFNIQKYSVHDGPGIRTILFFKGCPLRCRWCSNPESQSHFDELAFNETRCLTKGKCTYCERDCPNQAISFLSEKDIPVIDRTKCTILSCNRECTLRCHAGALKVFGRKISVEDALREVEKDGVFYQRSSGGLTVSGGEPCFQPEFLLALLREAERRYVNVAMETCGLASYDVLSEAAQHLDTLIYDIKHLDPEQHKKFTGVDNSQILNNIKRLSSNFRELPILLRTPVIPGFNNSEETIRNICDFIESLPGHNISYELLAYHRLGTQKYLQLDRKYPMGSVSLDKQLMEHLQKVAASRLGGNFVL